MTDDHELSTDETFYNRAYNSERITKVVQLRIKSKRFELVI